MARILGIDYGRRRVGLAVSDDADGLSFPLDVLQVRDERDAVSQVVKRCRHEAAARVVVGMPLNMDGTRGPMAEEVARFVTAIADGSGLPVETWDERLTTWSVEEMLIEADVSRQKRKAVRDKLAAQQILQGWLDARGGDVPKP